MRNWFWTAIMCAVIFVVAPPYDATTATTEKDKQWAIDQLKAAFGPSDEPDWVSQLRRSDDPLTAMCRNLSRLEDIRFALRLGIEEDAFAEAGITRSVAMERTKAVGLETAKGLVAVFQQPLGVRKETLCGDFEGAFYLTDSGIMMSQIVAILQYLVARPEDIDQTPAGLRELLRTDLRAQVNALRNEDGSLNLGSDATTSFSIANRDVMENYGFVPTDLGLTSEEAKALGLR